MVSLWIGCHTACDGGCHKEGLDGCHDCKKGWRQNTDDACEDIDECEGDEENKLCSDGQFCRNSPGSFECEGIFLHNLVALYYKNYLLSMSNDIIRSWSDSQY